MLADFEQQPNNILMKKSLLTIVFFLLFYTLTANSQEQSHMTFMGIPLTGTITQFQAKLAAKGVAYDATTSRSLDVGTRFFKGTFSGKKASIYVYYNEKSKVVYRAKAVISSTDNDVFENNYNYFVNMLSQKYYDAEVNKGTQNNHETVTYLVPNDETALYKYLGTIDVYRTSEYPYQYLHIDYTDTVNRIKNNTRNMDDL
jgi:hypothetical protein